jgi:glycosyltransferase involved in cell wall biosynthesis
MPEPLRVLLVGNYPPDRQESMQRFAALLERGLRERDVAVTLVRPPARCIGERPPTHGTGKWLGYVDTLLIFPRALRQAALQADVVHVLDHSNAPYCRHLGRSAHLVTCHDLLAIRAARGEIPERPIGWSGRRFQAMILRGLVRARAIACVSRATRDDLLRIAGRRLEDCPLVPNGLNHPYRPVAAQERDRHLQALGLSALPPFLLHVGGDLWYKNRPGVLRIFAAVRRRGGDRLRLVMAGKQMPDELWALARELGIADRVHEVVAPDDEQLNALYNAAAGLLFPSLAEGFGWPVIEAQSAGCPVFTSDRAPLPEVGGDAACYFDPADAEAAAAVVLAGLPRHEAMRAAGLANAARFSAATMIEGYLALYRGLAAHKDPA